MVLLFVGVITLLFILDALLPLRKKLEGLPPSTALGRVLGRRRRLHQLHQPYRRPAVPDLRAAAALSPVIYSGTTALFFAIVNAAKLIPYFFLGQLSVTNLEHRRRPAPGRPSPACCSASAWCGAFR